MSRALPVEERQPLDLYATPQGLAYAICDHLRVQGVVPDEVIEPSAGPGAFVRAARRTWPSAMIRAIELDDRHRDSCIEAGTNSFICRDWDEWARDAVYDAHPFHRKLVLGNPPYREAQDHIEAALRLLAPGDYLAFLLRLNFLGSTARVPFWNKPGLVSVTTVAPRPSFARNKKGQKGTDGTEYSVFLWQRGHDLPPIILPPLVWRNREAPHAAP